MLVCYTYREAIEAYSSELEALTTKVLKMFTRALGMREEEMEALFGVEAMRSMRMNYYPPCPHPELVAGFSPHSDAAALTVLLQVNETGGLQIRKDGIWIPISPVPGAFIMNTGDIFEVYTVYLLCLVLLQSFQYNNTLCFNILGYK